MTRIKLCGLSQVCDIEAANALKPDFIGFVFAPKSRRYVTPKQAGKLRSLLSPGIRAVGVFVDEEIETICRVQREVGLDLIQLHGHEDEAFIERLRALTGKPVIKAFRIETDADAEGACSCGADYVLLDSGCGSGTVFDWDRIRDLNKPWFLAGGLNPDNVAGAIRMLHPFAVDVSSGIETGGFKDAAKMAAFAANVRKEDTR